MISSSISKKLNIGNAFYKNAGFIVCAAAFVLVVLSGGAYGRQDSEAGVSGDAAGKDKRTRSGAVENNKHKSGFIEKIKYFVKSGDPIPAVRFARLKNEIEKLRERITKRIEHIDKKTLDLSSERARNIYLLNELETAAAAFNKIKVEPAVEKTSEVRLHTHKTSAVEINKDAKKNERTLRSRRTN